MFCGRESGPTCSCLALLFGSSFVCRIHNSCARHYVHFHASGRTAQPLSAGALTKTYRYWSFYPHVILCPLNRRTKNSAENSATILSIQGRQHPVDVLYAEKPVSDYVRAATQAALTIHSSEPVGDILIFLPGAEEVDAAVEMLREFAPHQPNGSGRRGISTATGSGEGGPLQALPFYSALPTNLQMKVFEPTRQGVRRVVVATTIAETSVTIDGIRYVIDPGFVRLPFYDPTQGFGMLLTALTSKASAKQRAGRAGRVAPGKCFRLMTEEDYHAQLPAQTVPEMQRSDLTWVILLLKALGIDDILHFEFLSPPAAETMIRALELLYALGALDDGCRLTKPVGITMAEFPVEPCLAKFLTSAWDFHCVEVRAAT